MALLNSYGIWNNKGGVGKSTITYHIATRYAEKNPTIDLLVIDLCPQANSSMMLLGGGQNGEKIVMDECASPTPKTVVRYLADVITNGPGATLPSSKSYLLKVNDSNKNITDNVYLLCGDGNLEPIAPEISRRADMSALTQQSVPWVWIHNIFSEFINNLAGNNEGRDLMVFIDTNPAFGIYTELAMTASNRLLCPVNADDSSRTAANAMTILLHGMTPPHPIYSAWTFATLAKTHNVNIPKIHLVIGNRLTQYAGAAVAFGALSQATSQSLFDIYTHNNHYFTDRNQIVSDIKSFTDNYSVFLRDFNTVGVVSTHLGTRLSLMKSGDYTVHNQKVQVDKNKAQECLKAIDAVVDML